MKLPILEPEFKPAVIEFRKFTEDVKNTADKQHVIIAIERDNGYIFRTEFDCFADGLDDERNTFMVERIIKSILWVVGGWKIYLSGSESVSPTQMESEAAFRFSTEGCATTSTKQLAFASVLFAEITISALPSDFAVSSPVTGSTSAIDGFLEV